MGVVASSMHDICKEEGEKNVECPFCGTENQREHSECRPCGKPFSLKQETDRKEIQLFYKLLINLHNI